ncbi:MAG: amidohydrolase family protein [Chloroflexi bacterium]|nr:amidohydrolase family protein [Chloroflexota bacterium]MCH8222984.1 amidohydrolase family protein [Chloroflexota bacterium]
MPRYQVVIKGGRVLDYESGLDAVRDVAIQDGKIVGVDGDYDPGDSPDAHVIDAAGQWVMPGVVDAHAHFAGPPDFGFDTAIGLVQLAAAGVTTAIDLGGQMDVLFDGVTRAGTGITVGSLMRIAPGQTVASETPDVGELTDVISAGLADGSLGAKMWGGYYPLTPEGTARVIQVCNELGAHVAFHVGTTESGSRLDGLREIPEILGSTGRLHIAHVNAYCRGSILPPEQEVAEALQILQSLRPQTVSEVHMAVPNFTRGACGSDGAVLNDVPRNCLRLRGYEVTIDGMRAAILDGYGSVVVRRGDRLELVTGKDGLAAFEARESDVPMSFPVNLPSTAFALTEARDDDGEFIVDAVASDGGVLPRNVNIEQTMAMVRFGALSPLEAVAKLSFNPAEMFGLNAKGRLTPGADGDVTIVDPVTGSATTTLAGGRVVLREGSVVGTGGTILVTAAGEGAARASGLEYAVLDVSRSKMYR